MRLGEILDRVSNERLTPGRFPSRVIFARNFTDYQMLVEGLSVRCDKKIDLARFTRGDMLPRFTELKAVIRENVNKQILILSIGEYLRLCAKREMDKETAEFPGIWEAVQPEKAITKYIIPIFGGPELIEQVVPLIDERQKGFVWEIRSERLVSEYTITIYAPSFSNVVKTDASNLQDWLEKWPSLYGDKDAREISLTTKLIKYATLTYGDIKIKKVNDPFSYILLLITDGDNLKKEFGNSEFWLSVAGRVKKGKPFSATIIHILNMGHSFDPLGILARFEQITDIERRLLWIWYRLYPTDDYYTFAVLKAKSPADIPLALRDAIFSLPQINDKSAIERVSALKVLTLQYDNNYFSMLDNISPPEKRLALLTNRTIEERAYIIKTISEMLRGGSDIATIPDMIQTMYPELSEYLLQSSGDNISKYFNWYRKSKLINRPTTDIPCTIDFDDIDSRNKVLQLNGDSHVFWVDGLGVEWMPLLVSKLERLDTPVDVCKTIAKAILPTETEYNLKWRDNDDKWDRLDKLSHHGMPDEKDYFLCVVRQIEIIGEIISYTKNLLDRHNRVIITSDHGSSRLAALMFHEQSNYPIPPPKNSTVHSYGRFCEITKIDNFPITASMELVELDDRKFIVMETYEHFQQSGNAAGGNTDDIPIAGEVHGGMTPEEYLVPVIVVSRKVPLPTTTSQIEPRAARVNEMGI